MLRHCASALAAAILTAGGALAAGTPDCEALTGMSLENAKIDSAEVVPAGPTQFEDKPGQPPNKAAANLPAYCRARATASPQIAIEVWMPIEGWNGKFEGVGNHRFAGTIPEADMAMEMSRGYAVAGTTTGHAASDKTWMSDPQKLEDYGYRGIHEMSVLGQEIVAKFYGEDISQSYFNGCSTGGKQALTEAQRYPTDYDGIIVGDPNNYQSGNRGQYVWTAQVTFAQPDTSITREC